MRHLRDIHGLNDYLRDLGVFADNDEINEVLKSMNSPQIIMLSNHRTRCAIAVMRLVGRSAETMCELRDALNERRNQRCEDTAFNARFDAETASDLRNYGKIERTFSELYRAAL